MPVVGGAVVLLFMIIAVVVGLLLAKKFGLFGGEDKYDHKTFSTVINAVSERDSLDEMISDIVKGVKPGKTRRALEEELGSAEFRRLMRGVR